MKSQNVLPLIDFHSHFIAPNAFYCTAKPTAEPLNYVGKSLTYFEGLLPQFWDENQLKKLEVLLENPNIQLGEIGIDKRFEHIISLEKQFENLIMLLSYAKDKSKKVTIHSVKATELTIRAIKEAKSEPFSIIWHSFNGSQETAAQLYKMGVFVSLSQRFKALNFKNDISNSLLSSITRANPLWALETDYEGNNKNQYNLVLETHYNNVAKILGINVEELKEHCYGQAQTFTNKSFSGR